MIDVMNYRLNDRLNNIGPEPKDFNVDKLLVKAFISKPRTPEQIEHFKEWASLSKEFKETKEIESILQMVQIIELEQVKQATM